MAREVIEQHERNAIATFDIDMKLTPYILAAVLIWAANTLSQTTGGQDNPGASGATAPGSSSTESTQPSPGYQGYRTNQYGAATNHYGATNEYGAATNYYTNNLAPTGPTGAPSHIYGTNAAPSDIPK